MQFHFPLIDTVRFSLSEIFEKKYYADKVIERVLKSNPKMGSNDRGFVAETTYDIVRWWRLLNEVAENNYKTDPISLLNIISTYFFVFHNQRAQWKENYGIDFDQLEKRKQELENIPAIKQSIPDWMGELFKKELGSDWEKEMSALNRQASVCLRVNTLKISKKELQHLLYAEKIECSESELSPTALVLKERKNVFSSLLFKDGCYEVQDAGSQCISDFSDVKPGMRVIDACAGAGGKTLHLAALMENKGRILAMDTEDFKLAELKKRAKRAGAGIVETRKIEGSKTIKRLAESADLVVLDVPCSGLGTLKRNPDVKWKLNEQFIQEIRTKQAAILEGYSKMVKPGGKLIYATCSVLPSENQEQVQLFLSKNPKFSLEKERNILPSQNNSDGFYMAKLAYTATVAN